jgi:mRNA-degrading endonuclease toxin of MazEF toxin-antitoxin module
LASSRPSIRHRRIVFAWIKDRNGFAKLRPAIVLTEDDQIAAGQILAVMAVTTTFSDPPPNNCVPLPWHANEHPVTRLNRRSAAVINWLASVEAADVVGYGGDVPERVMRLIKQKLGQID